MKNIRASLCPPRSPPARARRVSVALAVGIAAAWAIGCSGDKIGAPKSDAVFDDQGDQSGGGTNDRPFGDAGEGGARGDGAAPDAGGGDAAARDGQVEASGADGGNDASTEAGADAGTD